MLFQSRILRVSRGNRATDTLTPDAYPLSNYVLTLIRRMPWVPYTKHFPDSGVRDLRYKYARGDIVRVVSGSFEGYLGEVSGVVFQKIYD